MRAVSFDAALYPFVQKYLRAKIPTDIVYHTWDLSLRLFNENTVSKLKKKAYFEDQRVKTILIPYFSDFDL